MDSKWKNGKVLLLLAFFCVLTGCSRNKNTAPISTSFSQSDSPMITGTAGSPAITIGFAQVGEESDWRRANSESVRNTFTTKRGYNLLFEDARNDPNAQLGAVSRFIQQGVDYIVLEPILETGWENVLEDVKSAGIPLILADRRISLEDESLYTAWVGSNPELEGQKVCAWMHTFAEKEGFNEAEFRIGVIQGTIGSSPQIGREKALWEAADDFGWTIVGSERGEFTQAKGREAMDALLENYPELNIVYCDNDNEAYGAIEALQAAGKTIGTNLENGEIMIVSFDAAKKALSYVKQGLIACDGECAPLLGPDIEKNIRAREEGKGFEKIRFVDEKIYAGNDEITTIRIDGKIYPVTPVTEKLLESRVY